MSNLSKNKLVKESKIIGKGGYGCVLYKPEIECSIESKSNTSVLEVPIKYINKIQQIKIDNYLFLQTDIGKTLNKEGEIPIIENRLTSLGRGSLTEVYFGKIIQTIPNYYMYFAPVIGYCPFDITNMSPTEKSSCFKTKDDIINTNIDNDNFLNTKSQYIEGGSLLNYFKTLSNNPTNYLFRTINSKKKGGILNDQTDSESFKHTILQSSPTLTQTIPPIFIEKFIQTYYYLMNSIKILQQGLSDESIIIHYDLKNENIVYDKKKGIPIIIDFGISFNKKELFESNDPTKLVNIFYSVDNQQGWCLDIALLSYIMVELFKPSKGEDSIKTTRNVNENIGKNEEDVKKLKGLCDDYIGDNKIFKAIEGLRWPEFREKTKQNWHLYIDSFVSKTWAVFIDELIKRYLYWDVYSISICYLDYLHTIGFLNGEYEIPEIVDEIIRNLHIDDLSTSESQEAIAR